jgi:hypothetical protein
MTRQEWLAHANPLQVLEGMLKANDSRVWLFACACCRMVPEVAASEEALKALDDAERCATGLLDRDQLVQRRGSSWQLTEIREVDRALYLALFPWRAETKHAALAAVRVAAIARWRAAVQAGKQLGKRAQRRAVARHRHALRQQQGNLLRCIVPHPARAFVVESLRTLRQDDHVRRIAEAIYQQGLFADLPVLGDALEDAGCHDPEVLAHCRGPGPHARGCWVIDHLVLAGQPTS